MQIFHQSTSPVRAMNIAQVLYSCALSLILLITLINPSASYSKELHVTPYRPTVSNPAQLPVPGYLELEWGWQTLREKSEKASRHGMPYLVKFAFSDRVGLLVGGDVVQVRQVDQGSTLGGFGDMTSVLKLHVPLPTKNVSALGLEGGIKFPTAPETLGTGRMDYLINGIYSGSVGRFGVDLNLGLTYLGLVSGHEGKALLTWAAATSFALSNRWSLAGEFAGSAREGVKPFSQFLTSTSYALLPTLVIDAGAAFGLNGASQEWTVFTGMTVLLW